MKNILTSIFCRNEYIDHINVAMRKHNQIKYIVYADMNTQNLTMVLYSLHIYIDLHHVEQLMITTLCYRWHFIYPKQSFIRRNTTLLWEILPLWLSQSAGNNNACKNPNFETGGRCYLCLVKTYMLCTGLKPQAVGRWPGVKLLCNHLDACVWMSFLYATTCRLHEAESRQPLDRSLSYMAQITSH